MTRSICVHGLGHTGLPTAALFANNGFEVDGFDTNQQLVYRLRHGELNVDEPALETFVKRSLDSGRFSPVLEPTTADVHFICVPTPLDGENRPDLRYVKQAGQTIATLLRRGDSVILESTVSPGTTNGPLRNTIEESGLVASEDFDLAHVPETVLPGNTVEELHTNDRVIGGIDTPSAETALDLYDPLIDGEVYLAENTVAAEFVKLIQNSFRDVNIALANEFAKLADHHGIDSRDAIDLANNHPRVDILEPGPGVGGHCIPIDPLFLCGPSSDCELIEAARRVNDSMTDYLIEILQDELDSLAHKRIAIFGIAYKGNVRDTRNSPGLSLARRLQAETRKRLVTDGVHQSGDGGDPSVETRLYDPVVIDQTLDLREYDEAISNADAIVITTDHDEFDDIDPEYVDDKMAGELVVDAKDVLTTEQWLRAGFNVVEI